MKVFTSSVFSKIKSGLEKTRNIIQDKISALLKKELDEETLSNLEKILIEADIGLEVTSQIIQVIKNKKPKSNELISTLKDIVKEILEGSSNGHQSESIPSPYVIMIVGVNGTGKTTSAAKIAHKYKILGKKVLLSAADTFRAAAQSQLEIWAQRLEIPIVSDYKIKDPGAIVYKSLEKAIKEKFDVVVIDTAGRLHNKKNLMEELARIRRIQSKLVEGAPHETLLTIDATTGTNALNQAKEFLSFTKVTGIILTKLDSSARGGCIVPVVKNLKLPIKYIGVGEKPEDLLPFSVEDFVNALFDFEKN